MALAEIATCQMPVVLVLTKKETKGMKIGYAKVKQSLRPKDGQLFIKARFFGKTASFHAIPLLLFSVSFLSPNRVQQKICNSRTRCFLHSNSITLPLY